MGINCYLRGCYLSGDLQGIKGYERGFKGEEGHEGD